MSSSGYSLKVAGFWFLAGLPVVVLVTALYTYSQPSLFFSRTVIELNSNPADISSAVHEVAQSQPLRLDHTPGTNLYSIGVYSADAGDAAAQANDATENVVKALASKAAYNGNPEKDTTQAELVLPSGKVWERAEPALAPTRPNAGRNMAYSWATGWISAVIGTALLVLASVRKPEPAYSLKAGALHPPT